MGTLRAPGASGLGSVRGDKALMRRAWSSGYEATGKR